MDTSRRAAISLVLAVIVALTLLPAALGDGSDDGDVTVAPPAAEPGDGEGPPAPTSTLPLDETSTTTTTTTSTAPAGDGIDDGDGDGGPTTTTVVAPVITAAPSSQSVLAVDVRAIGALIPGRSGVVAVSITNSAVSSRAAVVAVQITGATVIGAGDAGCAQSNFTVTCTVVVEPGQTVDLPVTIAVQAGAATVGVTVNVTTSGTDPAPVGVSLPTSPGGLAASVAMTGTLEVSISGNTLASCPDGASVGGATCASVRDGTATTALANDAWSMTEVTVDQRGGGSSSNAVVDVDPASVVKALLVWAASTPSSTPATAGTIRLATPATTGGAVPDDNGDYITVTADRVTSTAGAWQGVADVTTLVDTAGAGRYWVADIAAELGGTDAWAGWALVIVHSGAGPVRDVIVFDGLEPLSATALTAAVPSSYGTAAAEVAVLAWDGDRGVAGDDFSLTHGAGSTALIDSANPAGDLANSTIAVGGVAVTSGSPGYANTLGVDIDRFELGALTGPLTVSGRSPTDDVFLGAFVVVLTH